MVTGLKSTAPSVRFTIQNYHYETRIRHGKDGKVEYHRVRVNTHYAQQELYYSQWADQSPNATCIEYIKL